MEEDSLFGEEAEPPGSSTGSQLIDSREANFFPTPRPLSQGPVFLMKTAPKPVVIKENPTTRNFRKRFFPAATSQE